MKKFLFLVFVALFSVASNAATDSALVQKAEQYLNSITGLTGKFVQTANGKQQNGDFSMLRPGRVRLDYDDLPDPIESGEECIAQLEEAVDLVLFAFENGEPGDILVQKAPACTIQTQAEAVCELFGGNKDDIKIIGIRHGEKMYETLLTNEECAKAEDMGEFYRVPADNRTLNYDKFFSEGDTKRCELTEFNSDNTTRLTVEETKAKIASLEYIQNELNGISNVAK